MRSLLSLALLVGVVAALLYFLMGYQVVRTDHGYNVLKKKDWEFTKPLIDTRDWKLKDYLENNELSKALADLEWDSLKQRARDGWQNLAHRVEKATLEIDWEATTQDARDKLASVKQEAKQKYEALVRRFENKELNGEQFKESMQSLENWLDRQVDKIKREVN